jgi:hypothetical protein
MDAFLLFSSPATAFNSLDVEVTNKKPASKSPPYDRPGMPAGCPAHTKYVNEFNGASTSTIPGSFWI